MGNVWGVLEGARQLHLCMDGGFPRTHHVQVQDLQMMLVWWPPNWTFPKNPFKASICRFGRWIHKEWSWRSHQPQAGLSAG